MDNRLIFHFTLEDEALTPDQARHVTTLAHEFVHLMTDKYVAGQREHGGNLFEKTPAELLDDAIGEAIDQVVYLLTLKRRMGGHYGADPAA